MADRRSSSDTLRAMGMMEALMVSLGALIDTANPS
jgi:hypothetical protein